ncbi:unnamed protein product, partial [Discosporangium mesarthrocarpum]
LFAALSFNTLSAQTFCSNCSGTSGSCSYPSITNNPDLTASCAGLDILFIIDESGSTNGFQTDIEDAVMTFLRSLNCVGVNMAVIEFSGTARYVKQAYTPVDGAFITGMQRYFDDNTSNPWTNRIFEPYDENDDGNNDSCTNSFPFCGTNWQAAFMAADALATPDLVLFLTDGIPTVFLDDNNPDFGDISQANICGNGQTTQRPEIVNAMKVANKIKGEGAHIFALGVGAFDPTDTSPNGSLAQLKRVSGNTAHNPSNPLSTIRNSDYAAESFDQLAECLATFSDALCEFDAGVTSEDGCPGDNNGALEITVPPNLLPFNYEYDGPGGNDGNGTSNSSILTLSNLAAGSYFIEIEVSYGSNCTRTEAFFETIGSQSCSGTPTISCPGKVELSCNPTDNNGDGIPDVIPNPAAEIAAGNVTGNNPNCDVTISHEGDSQILQDNDNDCLFYIIRTYRVNNKCGNGTNTCTQRFEWTISDFSIGQGNGSLTVDCIDKIKEPTPPTVNDACGDPITPTGPAVTDSPDPITCEGTRTYTWTYTDCEGNSHDWKYVYTIEYEDFEIDEEDGEETVKCLSEATAPIPPDVTDNCGKLITPTGPAITDIPDPLTCIGTRTYTWTYKDCEGNSQDWKYIYTIDADEFTIDVNDGSETVTCLAEATEPTPPSVNDACGNPITPTGPAVTDSPDPITCEGTRTYTWTYKDCEGN